MRLAAYTVDRLRERGIDVRLDTRLDVGRRWAHQLSRRGCVRRRDAGLDGRREGQPDAGADRPASGRAGRLPCAANLTVKGVTGVFAAGDCAAVPDLTKSDPNALCGPSAQHAVRQSKTLAANIAATVHGGTLRDYRHAYAGSVASLGLYRGVAEIYGIKLRGVVAWFMHRTYHVSRMPTFNRKVRVLADWTGALLFRREIVSLGQVQTPRSEFEQAARD